MLFRSCLPVTLFFVLAACAKPAAEQPRQQPEAVRPQDDWIMAGPRINLTEPDGTTMRIVVNEAIAMPPLLNHDVDMFTENDYWSPPNRLSPKNRGLFMDGAPLASPTTAGTNLYCGLISDATTAGVTDVILSSTGTVTLKPGTYPMNYTGGGSGGSEGYEHYALGVPLRDKPNERKWDAVMIYCEQHVFPGVNTEYAAPIHKALGNRVLIQVTRKFAEDHTF